jgi:hypothetical protein
MQQHLPLAIEENAPTPTPTPTPAGRRPAPARARRAVDWRIDARTRRAGMAGIARARAVLATTGERTEHRGRTNAA